MQEDAQKRRNPQQMEVGIAFVVECISFQMRAEREAIHQGVQCQSCSNSHPPTGNLRHAMIMMVMMVVVVVVSAPRWFG